MDCSLQPGIGSTSSFQQNDSKIEIQLCLLPLIATCPGFTRVHGNCGYCGPVLQIDFCFVYIIVHTWWCKSPRSCQHRAKLWLEHLSQIFVVINQCPSSETETVWIKGSGAINSGCGIVRRFSPILATFPMNTWCDNLGVAVLVGSNKYL